MSGRSRNAGDRRGMSPHIDTMYSLKVDNLTYRTRVEDLRRCFEKFGHIGDIYIPRDQFSRSSRGYAFVRFMKKRDAQDALERMDGTDLDGREIRVQFARYGRASATDSREKVRHRRTRSRSRSPRRSRHRSRSESDHRRSRSRSQSSRRSQSGSVSPSRGNDRTENGERDQRQEKK